MQKIRLGAVSRMINYIENSTGRRLGRQASDHDPPHVGHSLLKRGCSLVQSSLNLDRHKLDFPRNLSSRAQERKRFKASELEDAQKCVYIDQSNLLP